MSNKKTSVGALLLLSAFMLALAVCESATGTTPDEFFKVSFAANGGEPEPEVQLVQKGGLISLPEEMTKSGQKFDSWYKDEDCTELWDFERDVVIEDIILYAKWNPSGSKGGGGGGGGGTPPAPAGSKDITISVTGAPAGYLSPIETSTSFTVQLSGFTDDSDANNVGLQITSIGGLTFSGHNTTGNASSGTKSFTVTVTYSTITQSFSNPAQTITISGLTNLPAGYATESKTTTVNVYDGQAAYPGSTYDRRIPVNDNNIGVFNTYANTTDGLTRHYKLTGNVTLPNLGAGVSNWIAIGDASNHFTGSFDGEGNTITGLTINRPGDSDQGLFGRIRAMGIVKNVGLIAGSIKGEFGVGSVVGVNEYGIIINCYAMGYVNGDSYIGGLVGANIGTVQNCYATGNISGVSFAPGHQAGGVVGANYGTVKNCYSTGNVSGGTHAGGVVGDIRDPGIPFPNPVLQNCVALGKNVTATVSDVGRVWGISDITSTIKNNYARSDMTVTISVVTTTPISTDDTSEHGADITPASVPPTIAELDAFWTTPGNWDASSPWDFDNVWNRASGSRLPTLRNMPAGTQNPVLP